ncbi:Putative transposon protein [Durusdinium trenchii]|uniref:Transposon protein n=1 Tax=Durusdinium trenchii TaxID=1381693 RepID=A0ABP0JZ27_9DINO
MTQLKTKDMKKRLLAATWREKRAELNMVQKGRKFSAPDPRRAGGTGKDFKRSFRVQVEELKQRTRCRRCGKIGHWQRECKAPASATIGSSAPQASHAAGAVQVVGTELPEHFICTAAACPETEVLLVSSPGFAVLDSGCGKTIIGRSTLAAFQEIWRQHGVPQPAEKPEQNCFRFGNGEQEVSQTIVDLPVFLAGRPGYVKAAVVKGKAPLLLSRPALQKLQARLDFDRDRLTLFEGQFEVPLEVNSAGQYTIPVTAFPPNAQALFPAAPMVEPTPNEWTIVIRGLSLTVHTPSMTVARGREEQLNVMHWKAKQHRQLMAQVTAGISDAELTVNSSSIMSRVRSILVKPANQLQWPTKQPIFVKLSRQSNMSESPKTVCPSLRLTRMNLTQAPAMGQPGRPADVFTRKTDPQLYTGRVVEYEYSGVSATVKMTQAESEECCKLVLKARQCGVWDEILRRVRDYEDIRLDEAWLGAKSGPMSDGAKRLRDERSCSTAPTYSGGSMALATAAPTPSTAKMPGTPHAEADKYPPGISSLEQWGKCMVAFGKYKGALSYSELFEGTADGMAGYRAWCLNHAQSGSAALKDLVAYLEIRGSSAGGSQDVIPGSSIARTFKT